MRDRHNEDRAAFERDTKDHVLTIRHDDGVYRHLRCAKPGTYCYGFDIVTWPGHLSIVGDMGAGVFNRMTDMFEFFRSGITADGLRISADYWHEKLVADDKSPAMRFSPDLFRRAVVDDFRDWARGGDYRKMVPEARREMRQAIRDEVLWYDGEAHEIAVGKAMEFEYPYWLPASDVIRNLKKYHARPFREVYDRRLTDYTLHFKWRLYGIVWAIRQYDAMKADKPAVAA